MRRLQTACYPHLNQSIKRHWSGNSHDVEASVLSQPLLPHHGQKEAEDDYEDGGVEIKPRFYADEAADAAHHGRAHAHAGGQQSVKDTTGRAALPRAGIIGHQGGGGGENEAEGHPPAAGRCGRG